MVWRTDDIGRCQSGRTPELRAFGSYPCADAAINSWLRLGPYTASTDWGSLTSTDHGVRDRCAENLPRAVVAPWSGRPRRLAAPDIVHPWRHSEAIKPRADLVGQRGDRGRRPLDRVPASVSR